MTAQLAEIRRYAIKSIGGERLDRVHLQPATRLPGDREWAVLHEAGERNARASETAGEPDRWLPKSCFLRGVTSASLQAIGGGWQNDRITLRHPSRPEISFSPETEGDRLIDWLRPLWPADEPAPTRLVKGAAVWTDVKHPWVSILSLDSLAALETAVGQPLGVDRWRGNLWVKGWEPFAERDLIGQTIRIDGVQLCIKQPITRCQATSANTETGLRDIDMVEALNRLYDHSNFGVYAEVVAGGDIATGDKVAA